MTPRSQPETEKIMSAGATAGIIIAICVILGLCGFGVRWLYYEWRWSQAEVDPSFNNIFNRSGSSHGEFSSDNQRYPVSMTTAGALVSQMTAQVSTGATRSGQSGNLSGRRQNPHHGTAQPSAEELLDRITNTTTSHTLTQALRATDVAEPTQRQEALPQVRNNTYEPLSHPEVSIPPWAPPLGGDEMLSNRQSPYNHSLSVTTNEEARLPPIPVAATIGDAPPMYDSVADDGDIYEQPIESSNNESSGPQNYASLDASRKTYDSNGPGEAGRTSNPIYRPADQSKQALRYHNANPMYAGTRSTHEGLVRSTMYESADDVAPTASHMANPMYRGEDHEVEHTSNPMYKSSTAVKVGDGNDDDYIEGFGDYEQEHKSENVCCVCFGGPLTHMIRPCNHVCLCENDVWTFTSVYTTCPICRGPVDSIEKVYI